MLTVLAVAMATVARVATAAEPQAPARRLALSYLDADGAVALASGSPHAPGVALRLRFCDAAGTVEAKGRSWRPLARDDEAAPAWIWNGEVAGQAAEVVVSLDGEDAIRVQPRGGVGGVVVETALEYAILPSRFVDDTIYLPQTYPCSSRVSVPPENLVMGLAAAGNRVVVLAWPGVARAVVLTRDGRAGPGAGFSRLRVTPGDGPLHVALFDALGIWFRADITAAPLDRDFRQPWTPPHRARWLTQLVEEGDFPAAYEVRDRPIPKDSFWRATFGRYAYPVWVGQDGLMFQFCQKVPAKGPGLVYALDGHPQTPFEFLRTRLPAEARRDLTELSAVKPVREGDFVPPGPASGWAQACFGRDRMEASILRTDVQARERAFLEEHVRFRARQARGPETQNQLIADFIPTMTARLAEEQARRSTPTATAYLECQQRSLAGLDETFRSLMQGRTSAQELAYVDATVEAFCQGLRDPGAERLPELRYQLSEINDVLNRNHRVGGGCGRVLRKWFLTAALDCADKPDMTGLAVEIRQRLRKLLEHRNDESVVRVSQDLR